MRGKSLEDADPVSESRREQIPDVCYLLNDYGWLFAIVKVVREMN